MTAINRRRFIQLSGLVLSGSAGVGIGAAITAAPETLQPEVQDTSKWVLSACDDEQRQHWICGFQTHGNRAFRIPVMHRAHAVTVNPQRNQALYFARRPGTEIYVVDLMSGTLQQTVTSADGYHFFGHGFLSADGKYLFTSENAYDNGHGAIGVYDTQNFQKLDSFHSGGIGPHQLALLADDKTLVVANGGILTHPNQPRKALNIAHMQSSLTYLDSQTGKVLADYQPQHPQMSIRHLDVSVTDQVIMGVQFQGEPTEILPLVLSHQGEDKLQSMEADEAHWLGQSQYIASVAVSSTDSLAVTATPRGGNISLWNLQTKALIKRIDIRDVAGAVYDPQEKRFLLSNGLGEIYSLTSSSPNNLQSIFRNRQLSWDNHLAVAIG